VEMWFLKIEAIMGDVTDDNQRYHALVGALSRSVLKQVSKYVQKPPETNKYKGLKDLILNNYSDTDEQKLDKLLGGMQLGSKKPSILLGEMESLSCDRFSKEMVENLWFKKLPEEYQDILISVPNASRKDTADKIKTMFDSREARRSSSSCVAAISQPQQQTGSVAVGDVMDMFKDLTREFSNTLQSNEHIHRQRSRSYSRGRSASRSRDVRNGQRRRNLCWYHRKFKVNAIKWIKPCDWQPEQARKTSSTYTRWRRWILVFQHHIA
jgi:hypothetical protein